MMKNNIGKKIAETRKKLGFRTQNDFAQALGMPFRTLQTYEQGASVIPHTFFENLKTKFNIEIGIFFSEDNIQKVLILDEKKIDKTTLEIVNEQYNKALQGNKLKELRVYLLNFECDTEVYLVGQK